LSKAKFTPDGATEAIDINDPEFWNKIGLTDQSKPTESVNELVLPENAVRSARQSRKQYYAQRSFSRPPCSRCTHNATVTCRMCAKAFCTRHSKQHTEAHEVGSTPLFKSINQAQSSSSASASESEASESDAVISTSLGSSTESDLDDLHADETLDDDAVKLGAKKLLARKPAQSSSTSPTLVLDVPATDAADPKQVWFGDQVVTPAFLRMGFRQQDVLVLCRVFFGMLAAKIHSQRQYPDDPKSQVKCVRGFVRRQILTDASVFELINSTAHLMAMFSNLIGQWDHFQVMPAPAPAPAPALSTQASQQQTSQIPVVAQPTNVPVQSLPVPAVTVAHDSAVQPLHQASVASQPKQASELNVQVTPISEQQPKVTLPPQNIAVKESKAPKSVSPTPTASNFPTIPVVSGPQLPAAGGGQPRTALQRLDDALISAGFKLGSQIQDARSYFGFLAFHRLKCTEHVLNFQDKRSPTQLMKQILQKQIHHEARNGGGSIFNTARVLQSALNARALYSLLEGLALACYKEDPKSLQFPLASMPDLPPLQQPLPPPPPPMDVSILPFSSNPGTSSVVSNQRKEPAIVEQFKKTAIVPVPGASSATQSEISVNKSDQATITSIISSPGHTRAELFDQLNEILSQHNILQHVEILDVFFYFRAVSVMWTLGSILHRDSSHGQHEFLKLAIESCLGSSVSSDFCSGFVKQLIRAAANLAVVGSKISELCNKLQPLVREIEAQKRPESSVQALLRKHFNNFTLSDEIYVQLSSFLLMFVNLFWFRCLLARVNMRLLLQAMLAVAKHFQSSAEKSDVFDLLLRTPTMISAFKSAATDWLFDTEECSQISLVKLSGRKHDLVAEVDAVWESFAQCIVGPDSQGESPPLKKSKHSTPASTSDSTSEHSFSVSRLSDDSGHQGRRSSTELNPISLRDARTTSAILSTAPPQASVNSCVDPISDVAKTAKPIESSENPSSLVHTEIQSFENVASMDVEPASASSAPQTDSVVASVASIDQPSIDTLNSVPNESVPRLSEVVIQSSDALVSTTSLIRNDPIIIDDDDENASLDAFVSDSPFENSIVQNASNSIVTVERKVEFVWHPCQGKFDSEFKCPAGPTWAPGGIAVSSVGEVISVDNDSHTIFVHDLEGNLIRSWASPSVNVSALFVSAQNEIWMLDHRHHCIFVSHLDGSVARKKLSSRGEMPGELYYPHAIAVSPSGKEVYVADSGNHRVQVYRTETRKWGILHASGIVFNKPAGLALTSTGSVVISDSYNHRIVIVSSEGILIHQWQTKGAKDNLIAPCSVVVSPSNEIFVCFQSDSRIQTYDLKGNLLRSWKTTIQPQYLAFAPNGRLYCSDGVALVHVFK
jgi:DNA-binding beta-propeller fold protein YncE